MQKINESLFKKYWVLKTEMILICFMMGFMILWTAGISPSQAWAKENKGDDVLRLFYWQAPTVFNPYLATGNKDREICRIVYEPLASPDHNGNLIPILAETIPTLQNGGLSKDGKAVIWNLKSGLNGRMVTLLRRKTLFLPGGLLKIPQPVQMGDQVIMPSNRLRCWINCVLKSYSNIATLHGIFHL